MHPLIHVPLLGWTIPSYAALYLLAGLFSLVVGPRWIGFLADLDRKRTRRATAVLFVVALAGGRLHFVVTNWPLFAGHPVAALALWSGGRHAAGALAMLVLAAPWCSATTACRPGATSMPACRRRRWRSRSRASAASSMDAAPASPHGGPGA